MRKGQYPSFQARGTLTNRRIYGCTEKFLGLKFLGHPKYFKNDKKSYHYHDTHTYIYIYISIYIIMLTYTLWDIYIYIHVCVCIIYTKHTLYNVNITAFLCLSLSKARSAGFFSEEEMKERDPQPWTERRGHIMVIINLGVLTCLTY